MAPVPDRLHAATLVLRRVRVVADSENATGDYLYGWHQLDSGNLALVSHAAACQRGRAGDDSLLLYSNPG